MRKNDMKGEQKIKESYFLKSFIYAMQGAIVGVGAILPGVSGGVLCVAFGIYEPMMSFLIHPKDSFQKYYKMFIPFSIGWVVGFLCLAKGVQSLFEFFPEIALMLFFGLICGTLPELFDSTENKVHTTSWTPFVLSLAIAYIFFHILENGTFTTITPSFISYLLTGSIWGLSLIIPGLSSASFLIFIGLYEPMLLGIGALDFHVIIPCLIGFGGTVVLFARLVAKLFEKNHTMITRLILGFVIASSLKILPTTFDSPFIIAISFVCFIGGFVIARGMDCVKISDH